MAYSLSQRHMQDGSDGDDYDDDRLDLSLLATVCFVIGLLSLVTAWLYSGTTEKIYQNKERLSLSKPGEIKTIGPILVKKYHESFHIEVQAYVGKQQWSFIEGMVLDSKKNALFSFGEDIWHETGYDSDGRWSEMNRDYEMDVTIPKPGSYYFQFRAEQGSIPSNIKIKVTKRRGSSLPHLWYGIILIIVGIVLNEIRNRTIRRAIGSLEFD